MEVSTVDLSALYPDSSELSSWWGSIRGVDLQVPIILNGGEFISRAEKGVEDW